MDIRQKIRSIAGLAMAAVLTAGMCFGNSGQAYGAVKEVKQVDQAGTARQGSGGPGGGGRPFPTAWSGFSGSGLTPI